MESLRFYIRDFVEQDFLAAAPQIFFRGQKKIIFASRRRCSVAPWKISQNCYKIIDH